MTFVFRVVQGLLSSIDSLYSSGLKTAPDFDDAGALALRAELKNGNWQAARDALQRAGKAWDQRNHVVLLAAEWPRMTDWIDAWLKTSSNQADPHLVRGVMGIFLAWEARGAGYAETVGDEGARLFFERLSRAVQDLREAARLAPDDPTPWAHLIRAGRGIQHDRGMVEGYLTETKRRDPEHFLAHHEMLQYDCAKWYGSREQMWGLAKQVTAEASPGSPLHSVIPAAHLEHAIELEDEDESGAAGRKYWSRPDVSSSNVAAFQRMQSGDARESPDLLQAHSFFAYALWKSGATQQAAEALRHVDVRMVNLPWQMESLPARTFRRARRECGVQ